MDYTIKYDVTTMFPYPRFTKPCAYLPILAVYENEFLI